MRLLFFLEIFFLIMVGIYWGNYDVVGFVLNIFLNNLFFIKDKGKNDIIVFIF